MLKRFIAKVVERQDLTEEEAHQAMGIIMDGEASPAQIASFVTGLRMKGETIQEITGFARSMRARAVHIAAKEKEWVVDTCGTGGDGSGTFNISTTVSFVAAGEGLDGGQTWQSLGIEPVRQRRCLGGLRGEHPAASRKG